MSVEFACMEADSYLEVGVNNSCEDYTKKQRIGSELQLVCWTFRKDQSVGREGKCKK